MLRRFLEAHGKINDLEMPTHWHRVVFQNVFCGRNRYTKLVLCLGFHTPRWSLSFSEKQQRSYLAPNSAPCLVGRKSNRKEKH